MWRNKGRDRRLLLRQRGGPVAQKLRGVAMLNFPDSEHEDRGRNAERPSQIPLSGWKDVVMRIVASIGEDRAFLVAAGATFYLLLALFPALVVFVSAYGFFADPATVAQHVSALRTLVPASVLEIVSDQLESLATQESGTLSSGLVIGLLVAFWSANHGIKALFDALNVAYGEAEKRSFIGLNMLAFAFTLCAMLTAAVLITAVGIVPIVLQLLNLSALSETLLSAARWPVLIVLIWVGISMLYRYGPSREPAKWRWITWGGALATIVWIATSAGFSIYLQSFANYEATYGSLGAAIGLMMWTWISVVILIVGAKLNAEMEHQTRRDSTTGPSRPMGQRGAVVADTLGK